jgi:uncharacterized protein YciI
MFIVSLTYTAPLEEVDKHLDDHVTYLKRQYAAGNFVASGRKVPRTGGVILSKLENRATLDAVLAQDPFHHAGVADYEVIEFVPSMVAEGFEILQ